MKHGQYNKIDSKIWREINVLEKKEEIFRRSKGSNLQKVTKLKLP